VRESLREVDLIELTTRQGWLIRHNRPGEARNSLLRLTTAGKNDGFNVDETVEMMLHTNEVEKRLGGGHITYLDCFKGINLRRTEMVWDAQRFSGATLTAYAAFFYEQAGFAVNDAFNFQLGMYGLGFFW
jgi:MFS transporter, SP family, general alpha glucoside:H+ symporter